MPYSLDDLNANILGVIETSFEIEDFDLHSADLESCMHYRALRRLYVKRTSELIEMIETGGTHLREQLNALLRDC